MNDNNCDKAAKLISKRLDGRLSEGEAAALDEHLRSCPGCRVRFKELARFGEIAEKSGITVGEASSDKIFGSVLYALSRRPGVFSRDMLSLRYALPAAAALVLLFFAGYFYRASFKPEGIQMTFQIAAGSASSVSLVGDFHGWNKDDCRLIGKNGVWTATYMVKPGRYQYVFVIDGNKWVPDPNAGEYIDNGFGSRNSIVDTTRL